MWLKDPWDRVFIMKRVSCMATGAPPEYAFNAAGVWIYPRPFGVPWVSSSNSASVRVGVAFVAMS